MLEFASNTRTDSPARANVIAAARPFGPEPTTTASHSSAIARRSRGLRPLFPTQSHPLGSQSDAGGRNPYSACNFLHNHFTNGRSRSVVAVATDSAFATSPFKQYKYVSRQILSGFAAPRARLSSNSRIAS